MMKSGYPSGNVRSAARFAGLMEEARMGRLLCEMKRCFLELLVAFSCVLETRAQADAKVGLCGVA